jgi:N-acyl-D-amino-acid deacylase
VADVNVTDPSSFPHPRGFGNNTRVIARYVKERKVLTLEEAVRKMTSWPATRMRLADRGVIRVGAWADVAVFDLDAMADKATYEKPTELAEGVEYVLVNGVLVLDRGKHTGAKPGKVLRGPGASMAAAR